MSAIYSCREAARLLSEAQDHPLRLRQRVALQIHTGLCSACRAYARQIRFLDEVFALRSASGAADLPSSEALGAAARERIRARLRG
jgi:hypothetical protein